MVGPIYAVEPYFLVGSHAGKHIGLSLVVEGLHELLGCPSDVPEVDEEDLLLLSKMPDDRGQVVSHESEVALTECDAVDGTGIEIEQALVVLYAAHDTCQAPDGGQGRIIGMHRELDASFLSDRHDDFEEGLKVFPQLLLWDLTIFGEWGILHELIVEARSERTAARGDGGGSANPVHHRHPLVAPDWDAQAPHVLDERDIRFLHHGQVDQA